MGFEAPILFPWAIGGGGSASNDLLHLIPRLPQQQQLAPQPKPSQQFYALSLGSVHPQSLSKSHQHRGPINVGTDLASSDTGVLGGGSGGSFIASCHPAEF